MDFSEYCSLVDDRSAALRSAVSAADSLSVRVPGCPAWSLHDLVAHVGAVQRFWATAIRVASPPSDALPGPPTAAQLGDREPHGDLLRWSAESTRMLLDALHDPAAPCWAWWPAAAAPHTVLAVARHQMQEAAVHARDAQEAIGRADPLSPAVAIDSIAEFLSVNPPTCGPWPGGPATLLLRATEGPSWTLALTPDGSEPGPERAAVTVGAPASDLLLALHGRISFDGLPVTGDRSVLTTLLEWGAATD